MAEVSTTKYTERAAGSQIMGGELDALANGRSALAGSPIDNSGTASRQQVADFRVSIAAQAAPRTNGTVSLIIATAVNGIYPDVVGADAAADQKLAANHIARRADGGLCTAELDDATTAREIVFEKVQVPNSLFRPGVLQQTSQDFAASGNSVWMSGMYTYAADDGS